MKRRTFVQSMGIGALLIAMGTLAKGSIDKGYGLNSCPNTKRNNYLPETFQDLFDYIKPGDMVLIGGRPSMGKTSFALNMALEYAKTQNIFIFSAEHLAPHIYMKLLSIVSGLSLEKIISKDISEYELQNIVTQYISDKRIHIDDRPVPSSQIMYDYLNSRKVTSGDIIIIDDLQLMDNYPYSDYPIESFAKNLYDIELLARQKSLRVIVLSQITRAVEYRKDKRPLISDIRESIRNLITHRFNKIFFIYRPEYYGLSDNKNELEIIFRKPVDFIIKDEYFLDGRFENLPQQARSIAMGWQ